MGEPAGSGVRGGAESPSLSDDEEYQKLDSEALWQQAQKGDTAAGESSFRPNGLLPSMGQGLDVLLEMRRPLLAMLALWLCVQLAAIGLSSGRLPRFERAAFPGCGLLLLVLPCRVGKRYCLP